MNRTSIAIALAALVLAQPALPDTVHLNRSAPVGGPSSDAEVGRDAGASNSSTWRWYVSKVLDNQRKLAEPTAAIGAPRFKLQP